MSSPIVMMGTSDSAGADSMRTMTRGELLPHEVCGPLSHGSAKSFDHRSVVDFFARTRAYDVMPENGKVRASAAARLVELLFSGGLGR